MDKKYYWKNIIQKYKGIMMPSQETRCRKYKQQIENLKMDLSDLQDMYNKVVLEKANLKRRYEKNNSNSF